MRSLVLFSLPLFLACQETIKTSPKSTRYSGGEPEFIIEETVINFGMLVHGSMGSETISIRNNGGRPLEVTDITVTSPFLTSAGTPIEISPGTSTPVSVQFLANIWHSVEGALIITTNDPENPQITIPIHAAVIKDTDGDGHDTYEAGGYDCNDNDPSIYPGAEDEWYDGVDSDCMNNDDYDQDGDGFQTVVWNENSEAGGGDCQDANPNMYPGAPDAWYDGVDSDCDGRDDYDQDGDGSRSLAEGRGTDCNDFDASVNTSSVETLNGQDDNCDEKIDNDVAAWNSDLLYVGSTAGDKSGFQLTTGDLDEDGYDDLIIGSPGYSSGRGHVSIFSGDSLPADGSNIEYSYNDFPGSNSADSSGFYVGFYKNFTGDEIPTLAVGSPGHSGTYGRISFIDGDEAMYGGDLDDAYLTITGTSGSMLGVSFSQNMDMNGDGLDDIVGYYASAQNGNLFLLYGGEHSGDIDLTDVDARFSTNVIAETMTRNLPNGGDLDGDGFDDAVFCDGTVDVAFEDRQGAVWILWGSDSEYSNNSPDALGSLNSNGEQTGAATLVTTGVKQHHSGESCGVGPDWDGDGDSELWVFYPGDSGDHTGIYMIPGSSDLVDASYDTLEAYSHYVKTRTSNSVTGFRNVGDWDNDNIADIGVSFSEDSDDGGQAWMIHSHLPPGEYQSRDVATVEGDADYNQMRYGNVISSRPGDLNGDGMHDWIVSDWAYTGSNGNAADLGGIFINYNLSAE